MILDKIFYGGIGVLILYALVLIFYLAPQANESINEFCESIGYTRYYYYDGEYSCIKTDKDVVEFQKIWCTSQNVNLFDWIQECWKINEVSE